MNRYFRYSWIFGIACLAVTYSVTDVLAKTGREAEPFDGKLDIVWARQLYQVHQGVEAAMSLVPFNGNFLVSLTVGPENPSATVSEFFNMLLNQDGAEIWRHYYKGPDLEMRPWELLQVEKRLYGFLDILENEKEKRKRYNIWIDPDGYVESVTARRHHPIEYQSSWTTVENASQVYNYWANCTESKCSIERAPVGESGLDTARKETVHVWPFSNHELSHNSYRIVASDRDFLLVRKNRKRDDKQVEYVFLIFMPASQNLISSRQNYDIPDLQANQTLRDGDGFTSFIFGKKASLLVKLDEKGQERTRTYLSLPYFMTNPSVNSYSNGWIIIGFTGIGSGKQEQCFIKVAKDGQVQWHFKLGNQDADRITFLGINKEHLFFSRRGMLYKCKER